ncbi:MAG: CBS domain-containing protein, partial [Elusimicrobia bacterium]|nr:CBS domain-containing protein [Elusimicrobiota bacterium]
LTQPAAARGIERRILEGSVRALRPKPALTIGPVAPVSEAVERMRTAKVGCLLVIEDGKLVGVLSERELLHNSIDPLALAGSVGALMRADATCLREEDSVADAFHAMAVTGHRHLPVARAGGYSVVSVRDLLHYLCA